MPVPSQTILTVYTLLVAASVTALCPPPHSDETVKFVNELHVILYGIYTHRVLARRPLFLEFSRVASLYGSGCDGHQMEVLRSFPDSPHRLVVLRSWPIIIIAVKQHQLLGFWRITAQSNTEARGKIACCPSDRPDNMVHQLADVDQHHVRCRCAIDQDPETLYNEHCFISLSQTPKLVDERRRYMTQFVLENICHLHATLLTDDQQSANMVSMSKMALPFTITNFFISCIVFTFLSILLRNAPGSKAANFSL